jgi:hypothetical protein
MQPTALRAHIDHIVVAVQGLDDGIAAFARLTGVTAVRGGKHPARGTENALVALGRGRYLELIAPRAGAPSTPDLEQMRSHANLTVIAWAVAVNDLNAARQAVTATSVTIGPSMPGSRVTPSGQLLEWSTASFTMPPIATAPFLIQWKRRTPHPSATSPAGCTVSIMEVHDPDATDLSRALDALRVSGVSIRRGDTHIRVTLNGERGPVTLASD